MRASRAGLWHNDTGRPQVHLIAVTLDARSNPTADVTDRQCLRLWRREGRAEALRPLVERYARTVFWRAMERLENSEQAARATQVAFLVMARRLKKAAKLERWLCKVTLVACRKLKKRSFSRAREWFELRKPIRSGPPLPDGLIDQIVASVDATGRKRPKEKLAKWVLRKLFWARWRKRFVIANVSIWAVIAVIWIIEARRGYTEVFAKAIVWSSRLELWWYSQEARPWKSPLRTNSISTTAELYRTTNVWPVHVSFTREQWKALNPRKVEALPNFLSEGQILLHNPKAPRNGLGGVLGYAFDWSSADVDFAGIPFTNVALRIKGNVGALVGTKRPFKVDLNKHTKGQKLAGLDELTFNNLLFDASSLCDVVAYQLFRDAGVPASRTAFTWVTTTVEKQWNQKPLGLFMLLETVDEQFAAERFGTKKTAIFKPVTYHLFADLGEEWAPYATTYDPKTKVTASDRRRIIDFARLVSNAGDQEFGARVGNFLDLDEFAAFMAGEVLLASYDGILTTGQNFYMYIDPHSSKIGFIPWDLDSAWGNIWIASKSHQQRASIWRPWSGENRFLERVYGVEQFRLLYRAHLEDMLTRLFTPERIQQRIDEIAAVIRGPIGAESTFRLDKFEQAIGAKPVSESPDQHEGGLNQRVYPFRKFVETRARSVRAQLDGKTKGLIIPPMSERF